jgi:uncharacterized 2Fe-2S/4Fe-4S cluster protein (DUF4445 family)
MEEITAVYRKNIEIKLKDVLVILDINYKNSIKLEIKEIYDELKEEIHERICPKILFKFEIKRNMENEWFAEPCIYVILTIGTYMSEYSNRLFQSGEYLKGMVADAMADAYLFELDRVSQEYFKSVCREKGYGISRRLEVPSHLPFEAQSFLFERLEASNYGFKINKRAVLEPAKSLSYFFLLTEDKTVFHTGHNCRRCERKECNMRKVEPVVVNVLTKDGVREILCSEEKSILKLLQDDGIYINAVCAGRGTCKKCRIKVEQGIMKITEYDRKAFTKVELEEGYRLACRAYPEENCTVSLGCEEESFRIASALREDDIGNIKEDVELQGTESGYAIAIDIGSTTIASTLIGLDTAHIYGEAVTINHQRAFGADVISRIQKANEGQLEVLQASVREDLQHLIRKLLKRMKGSFECIKKVVIACNTTMVHLLMGYSCEKLGVFPFESEHLGTIRLSFKEIMGADFLDCEVIILPGISAFVGGDITSGLLSAEVLHQEGNFLLIDFGTNGEMAIGTKNDILVTSAAAGPAFEGGNIQWGTGSIEGAVSDITIEEDGVKLTTIGNAQPVGICGTGVIAVTAELVRNHLVDDTGMLEESYEAGYPIAKSRQGENIIFTQKDIREIQLAKSAIRAGIESLILKSGIGKRILTRYT